MAMTADEHYTDFPPGNLEKLLEQAITTGIPPHVHAIGDKGNRIILDIYEKLLTKHGLVDRDHRWRVIHAQVVHPADFPRFGRLKLIAEINPYHVSDDMRWMEERIGADRSRGAYAFRKLKDAGAVLIFGSDSPGTNAARYFLSPVYGLYAAVTRQTLTGEPKEGWFPEQRLSIEEAIEAYTSGPAWASFEENLKGTLTPGKLADVAVFETNLLEAGKKNPAQLLKAKVNYTIVGGKVVYERKCLLCHGEKGDGKGPAAELLVPQPRDFTSGIYKIRSTANKTPTDQDIFNVITNGMPGTSMPDWKVLPEKDRWNLLAYIKTFAGDKLKEGPKKLELPKEVASSAESLKRGKEMFEAIECHKCHGNAGRADGPAFLNVLSDCPLGWGHEAQLGPRIGRLAVESRFWPLYEVVDGRYRLTYDVPKPVPLVEWLRPQTRFRQLLLPENAGLLAEIEQRVERDWQELVARCG